MKSKTPNGGTNNSPTSDEVSKTRRYLAQIIAVSVKNVLLLIYGLSMGIPTMLIPNLAGGVPGESIVLDEDGISWIGSLNYLSVPVGCLMSGAITRPFGRIRSMQAICVLFFAAFLIYYFASQAWHVFLALFLTGFTGGLLEAPTLIYTVEITEPSLRGAMSSTSTLGIVIGIITSFVLGTVFPWRIMAMINGGISLVGLVILFFIPESPYWLITNHKLEVAKRNLAWLRGWSRVTNIQEEFERITKELEQEENDKLKQSLKLYLKPVFFKPYLLICLMFVLAHFGTTQMNVFAVKIFQLLQAPIDSYYATILIGAMELLGCILLMLLVRSLGKRLLMFISQLGVSISFLLVGVYTYNLGVENFESTNNINDEVANHYSWMPLVAIISVGFFSYLMTYTLPWIIMGELYPNDIRDTASGLSAGTGYVIGFLANKTFLNLVNVATLAAVFWIYSAVAAIGFVSMYLLLPETEGKPLAEVTDHYAGRGKLNNKVARKRDVAGGVSNKGFENDVGECVNTKL